MNHKILLADDSVTVQKIITLTFSDEGVDVLTVNTGEEAIHRLQYMRPALVMADVSIPGKNGYEICEFVKNHPEMKNTPVVLLVPAFESFDEERARRIGADYHLTKPFQSIRTLIATVKNLIEPESVAAPTGPLGPPPAGQPDVKSSKIEELIRQAASVSDGPATRIEEAPVPPPPFAQTPVSPVLPEYAPAAEAAEAVDESRAMNMPDETFEFDDILELDDVLNDRPPAAPEAMVSEAPASAPVAPPLSSAVVDDIVNRVVAQLVPLLVPKLIAELDQIVARRVSAEMATVSNRPQPAPARRMTDSLLEID